MKNRLNEVTISGEIPQDYVDKDENDDDDHQGGPMISGEMPEDYMKASKDAVWEEL